MVVTVARKPRKPTGKTVITTTASSLSGLGGGGGVNAAFILAAAEPFAAAAKAFASAIPSTMIPESIRTMPDGDNGAAVVADGAIARQAYAYENGLSHPLFGNYGYWYPTPKMPFMTAAARNKGAQQAAMDIYAKQLDVLLAEAGWDE